MDEQEQVTEEEVADDTAEDESEEEETEEADDDAENADEAASEDEPEEDTHFLKERARILQEKLDRREAELERLKTRKPKPDDAPASNGTDTDIIRLEARGFLKKDEQDEIVRAAKSMGVSTVEAAEDEYVLAKIERMRKAKRAAQAADAPSNGSPVARRDANYYIRKGEMPKDPDMIAKVQTELARRSGAGYKR